MKVNVKHGSILGTLGVAFIALKLAGAIDWGWWLVLTPFWGGAALLLCRHAENSFRSTFRLLTLFRIGVGQANAAPLL